ncbi:vitelline membrane outer layer protein 1 homolog [Engystomops pustulosus]|uniref:vitelline membrane outer layer protein 1 homolog n=1 Tax=Engystomops pustulosus TaxID=76066 RepID=UPI003AFA15EA
MLPVLLLLGTLQNLVAAETIISVPNGAPWGDWGPMETCDEDTVIQGFQLKVEKPRGRLIDDTALNGIALYCTKNSSWEVVKIIKSAEGPFGTWRPVIWCHSGFLKNFTLRVEFKVRGDNTAANNIKFTCSDGSVVEGNGLSWGTYGPWSYDCNKGLRGIQTKVQGRRGAFRDDVGLTDVKFMCR